MRASRPANHEGKEVIHELNFTPAPAQVGDQGTAQIPAKIYANFFWTVSLALKVVFPDLRLRKEGKGSLL